MTRMCLRSNGTSCSLDGKFFDITAPTWRLGEALLEGAYIAKALHAVGANLVSRGCPREGSARSFDAMKTGFDHYDVLWRPMLDIRVGYQLIYDCPQPTPMMLVLNIHYSRAPDIIVPDHVTTIPYVPLSPYRDGFGNWCTRLVAPRGQISIANTAIVRDSGEPDIVAPLAHQHVIQDLPEEALVFLLGSRYCDTENFYEASWRLFGSTP